MFNIKGLTKSKFLTPVYRCPHCEKEIMFELSLEHAHKFKHEVETDNVVKSVKILKNVK